MSLIAKLRFTDTAPLTLLNAPADCANLFRELQAKTTLNSKETSQVMLFVENRKALDAIYNKILPKLSDNAVFWIAYPKKTSGIESDLIRNSGWDVVSDSDYRIVSSIAINEQWSGVRISRKKPDEAYKSSVPMQERKVIGIDYVKRTVVLPPDALKMMKPYKGLDEFFYSMSFSHKREYVEAIEDAKKPETRLRRIEKMVEALQQLKSSKKK